MKLYVESSAVLSWLFGEERGVAVRQHLRRAEMVFASDLALVECDRVIIRARVLGEIPERKERSCRSRLLKASNHWNILRIAPDVIERARLPFPVEPVRTLDALHLASALTGQTAIPDLAFLTLDARVRVNAEELGFKVLPK